MGYANANNKNRPPTLSQSHSTPNAEHSREKKTSVLLLHPVHSGEANRSGHRDSPTPALAPNVLAEQLALANFAPIIVDEFWMFSRGEETRDATNWARVCSELITSREVVLLGVTMLTYFRRLAHDIIDLLKQAHPQLRIVVGGPHASAFPQAVLLQSDTINAAFIGEADASIVQVVKALLWNDEWPVGLVGIDCPERHLPDYQVVNIEDIAMPTYRHYPAPIRPGRVAIMSSRGCPTPFCTFCGITSGGGRFRQQSITRRRAELSQAVRLGVRAIEFHDSIFTLRPDLIEALFCRLDLGDIVEFYCHTRPNDITPRVLDMISQTGRRWRVFVGLESANTALRRDVLKSELDIDDFASNMRFAREVGISIGVFLIFGMPGEDFQSVQQTYQLLDACEPAEVFASPLKYIPGSVLYRQALSSGLITSTTLSDPNGPAGLYVAVGEALLDALAAVEVFNERFDRQRDHNRVEREQIGQLIADQNFINRVESLRLGLEGAVI